MSCGIILCVFEVSVLLLQLVVTDVKSVPADRVVSAHGVLVKITMSESPAVLVQIVEILIIVGEFLLVEVPEDRSYEWLVAHVSALFVVRKVLVRVNVLRILHASCILVLQARNHRLRVRP